MLILLQETTNGDKLPNNPLSAIQIFLGGALIAVIATVIVLFIGIALARRSLTQGRPWLDYGNFFIVALGLGVIIMGYLALLLFVNQFASGTQVLGFYAALSGATVGLVGTYFGVKTSSDTVQVLGRNGIAPLTVTEVTPAENTVNVDPNTTVTAAFSRAVDPASITPQTLQLMGPLPARDARPVTYNVEAQNMRVVFTQSNPPLLPGPYQATITNVRDPSGNQLVSEKTWTFNVA